MIEKIEISNFKSIDTLELDLGRFNVFIGDNGSGKSNILEAVAFGTAAASNKIDDEFLSNRGIRISKPELTTNANQNNTNNKPLSIIFHTESKKYKYELVKELKNNNVKWKNLTLESVNKSLEIANKKLKDSNGYNKKISNKVKNELFKILRDLDQEIDKDEIQKINNDDLETIVMATVIVSLLYTYFSYDENIKNYVIFSPEQNSLRTFSSESQIKPLGRNGEGLFNMLKTVVEVGDKSQFERLKMHLQIIDWFKDLEISFDTFGEKAIKVRDRFIDDEAKFLDQYSVNEGFLFILFYFLLFDSKKTPDFFAIDNIEASFHPDLCKELTKILTEITLKNKKQVLITTHSPFVLDGLDLNNPDVKLFMVYRNRIGATKVKPIAPLKTNMKLSEAWLKGFIGGKPKTFIS
jgi:predicted ATPase